MNKFQKVPRFVKPAKIAVVLLGFVLVAGTLYAWSAPPSGTPPTCPAGSPGCDVPINVSDNFQVKGGNLMVNSDAVNPIGLNVVSGNLVVPAGNVGIGTVGPQTKLHVAGGEIGLGTLSAPDTTAYLRLGASNDNNYYSYLGSNVTWNGVNWMDLGGWGGPYTLLKNSSGEFDFYVGTRAGSGPIALGTPAMTIMNGGNVGIGTAGPASPLHVYGRFTGGGFPQLTLAAPDTADGSNAVVNFRSGAQDIARVASRYTTSVGNGSGQLLFQTRNNDAGGPQTRMVIDEPGNVGIGTLDTTLNGTANSKFTIVQTNGLTALAVGNSVNGTPRFALNPQANGGWVMYDGGTGGFTPGLVQYNGNVGIGVIPLSGAKLDALGDINVTGCYRVNGGACLVTGGTITSLSQGSGITLTPNPITTSGTVSVNTTTIQSRVSGTCAAGSSIRVVNADGTVTCQADSGGTVTSVTGSGNIASTGGTAPNITFAGVLPIANGGTGGSTIGVAGSVIYSNGTTGYVPTTLPGTTGQVLTSNGGTAPSWTTPTVFVDTDTLQTVTARAGGATTDRVITVAGLTVTGVNMDITGPVNGDTTYNIRGRQALGRYDGWDPNRLYINGYSNFSSGTTVAGTGGLHVDYNLDVAGNVGIGTGAAGPGHPLDVIGSVSVGTTNADYLPSGYNWNYTLLLNAQDTSSIGFHDSGSNVGSIRFRNNLFTIGADDGWGVANVNFPGQITIAGGSQGKILTSDANGLASWMPAPSGVGPGTTNNIAKFTDATHVGNSQIFDDGTNVGIGTAGTGKDITFRGTEAATLRLDGGYTEFIVPSLFQVNNGFYVNGGTAYFNGQIEARTALHNDSGTYLTISGGTAGDTYFPNNVGIGTAEPHSKLSVMGYGGLQVSLDNGTYPEIGRLAYESDSTGYGFGIGHKDTVGNNYVDYMYFKDGGNVGIGITIPIQKLDVNGNTAVRGDLYVQATTNASDGLHNGWASNTLCRWDGTNCPAQSGGTVTSVTGTAPIVSSGGITPAISIPQASANVNGYLSSGDWTTFNNKGGGTVTGTGVINKIPRWKDTAGTLIDSQIFDDGTNVGIGKTDPNSQLHLYKNDNANNAEIAIQSGNGATVQTKWAIYNNGIGAGDGSLRFWNDTPTGEKNVLTLATSGNVGIGKTDPAVKLDVHDLTGYPTMQIKTDIAGGRSQVIVSNDNGNSTLRLMQYGSAYGGTYAGVSMNNLSVLNSSGSNFIVNATSDILFSNNDVEAMRIKATGNVGIGKSPDAAYKLDVAGNVQANAFFYSSDLSLKTNVQTISNALEKVLQLRGVEFLWKKDNAASVGVIAQEVEKVYPELVKTDPTTGLKSVAYGNLVGPLIEAVKELKAENDDLRARVEKLEAKNQ